MQLARVRTRPEVASAVRDALAGVRIFELPVTLRFWDGSVLDGGAPVIEVRDPVAFAHVLTPRPTGSGARVGVRRARRRRRRRPRGDPAPALGVAAGRRPRGPRRRVAARALPA